MQNFNIIISIIACSLISSGLSTNDDLEDRMIFSNEVRRISDYPFHAYLSKFSNETAVIFPTSMPERLFYSECGGVIINPSWILTAAHCLDSSLNFVKTGTLNPNCQDQYAQIRTISKKVIHKCYNKPGSKSNDIALIQLDKPLVFNENTSAVSLPSKDYKFYNQSGFAIGAGAQFYRQFGESADREEPVYPKLKAGEMKLISFEDCVKIFKKNPGSTKPIPTTFCAGSGINGTSQTCHGDSGGALIHGPIRKPTLVGITSYGVGCTSITSAYTNVQLYVPWILNVTDPKRKDSSNSLKDSVDSINCVEKSAPNSNQK